MFYITTSTALHLVLELILGYFRGNIKQLSEAICLILNIITFIPLESRLSTRNLL